MLKRTCVLTVAGMLTLSLAGCPRGGGQVGWVFDLGHIWDSGSKVSPMGSDRVLVAGTVKLTPGTVDGPWVFAAEIGLDGKVKRVVDDDPPINVNFGNNAGLAANASDGSIYLVGNDDEYVPGSEIGMLRVLKVSPTNEVEFDVLLGDMTMLPGAVKVASSGNLFVSAMRTLGRASHGTIIFELNPFGEVLNSILLDEVATAHTDIEELQSGSFALTGSSGAATGDDLDFILSKVDASLQTIDWHLYDLGEHERGRALAEAPNGDFVIVGTTGSQGAIIRTDSEGNLLWSRTDFLDPNAGNESDEVWDVTITPEGNIAIVGDGTTFDNIAGFFPVITRSSFIALLNPDGDLIWHTKLWGDAYGLTQTQRGTFMTTGNDPGVRFLTLIEVDMSGHIVN